MRKHKTVSIPDCRFEGVSAFDTDGVCIGMNQRMKNILSYEAEEQCTFDTIASFLFQDEIDRKRIQDLFRESDGHSEVFCLSCDKRRKWCEVSVSGSSKGIRHLSVLDITGYMEKMDSLSEERNLFKNICEELKDAVSFTGPKVYINKAWFVQFGYTEKDIDTYDPAGSYVNPKERDEYFRLLDERGYVKDFPVRLRRKDGMEIDCLYTSTVYTNKNGEKYYQGIIRDITEQNNSLHLLKESEQRFRTLFEESKDAISYYYMNGRIMVNEAWLEMFGYMREEIDSLDFKKLYADPKDREKYFEYLEKYDFIKDLEIRLVRKNGTVFDCIVSSRAHRDLDGKLLYYHGIIRDVTSQKKMMTDLNESKEKYRILIENISEILYSVDRNGVITYMSPVMESVTGWPVDELIGKRFADVRFVHPLDIQKIKKCFSEKSRMANPIDFRFISKMDDVIWFRASIHPLKKNGKLAGYQGILNNITKSVEAGQLLRESRERISSFLDSATDAFFLFDQNLMLIELNATVSIQFKVPRHILLGKTLAEVLVLIKYSHSPSVFVEVLNSGKPSSVSGLLFGASHFEFKIFKAGKGLGIIGSNITERVRTEMMLQESRTELERRVEKRTEDLYKLNLDLGKQIAEKTRVQEALALRESELTAFLDNLPDMAWLKNVDSQYMLVNKKFALLHDSSPENLKGKTDFDLWPEDLAQRYKEDDDTTIQTGHTIRIEEPFQTLSGVSFLVETIKGPIRDDSGKVIGTVGMARDITERKHTERILMESEERYRMIFEHAGVSLIELDFTQLKPVIEQLVAQGVDDIYSYYSGNTEYCRTSIVPLLQLIDVNEKTLELFEVESKDYLFLHIDEKYYDKLLPLSLNIINAIMNNRSDIHIELEGETFKGKKRYVVISATLPINNDKNNRILISVTDITERKRFEDELRNAHAGLEHRVKERTAVLAETNRELEREIIEKKTTEAALRESEEKYRTLFSTSIDAIWIIDITLRYVDVNQSLLDLFGYNRSEIIGNRWCMPFENRRDVDTIMHEIKTKGYALDKEVRFKRKDGVIIEGLATVTAWRNSEGNVKGYQGFYRDITEQKKAERILKYQAEFQELISKISMNFINIPVDTIDATIEQTLKTLGEFVHMDYGFVFHYSDDDTNAMLNYEWCRGDDEYSCASDGNPGVAARQWVNAHMQNAQKSDIVVLKEHSPDVLTDYYKSLMYTGESFIAIPMVSNEKLSGFFGFETLHSEKKWDDDTVSLLYLVGQMLENALEKKTNSKRIMEYQEKLRTIASELTLTEERERRRIAVELHDRIGQTLAVSKIKLLALQKQMPSPQEVYSLEEIRAFIEEAIRDTRSLIFEISPPVLYDLGFEAAIEWLVESIQQAHGIIARFHDDGFEKKIPHNMRILLFQTVRELLFNIVKHAEAQHADVILRKKGKAVEIEVVDDGVGFNMYAVESKMILPDRFGLFSIRERLDHLGGSFSIFSAPGTGTRVLLTAPLS